MPLRFEIGRVVYEVDDNERVVVSRWPDGVELVASPNCDLESKMRARALGYRGSGSRVVWEMTRDHDACHHLYAVALGGHWSAHLRAVALGQVAPGATGHEEECAVFLLQRAMNVGHGLFLETLR